ncbi:MAG: hypothetical protein ACI9W2_003235 [Gammaproteobacteria bacterium]|jgi:hypothetical protein
MREDGPGYIRLGDSRQYLHRSATARAGANVNIEHTSQPLHPRHHRTCACRLGLLMRAQFAWIRCRYNQPGMGRIGRKDTLVPHKMGRLAQDIRTPHLGL